jgi:hypothetical protein
MKALPFSRILKTPSCSNRQAQKNTGFELKVAATYGDILLDVLQHNRSQLAGEIHRAIAHTVNGALSRFPRKLRWHEKRAFQHVLHAPNCEFSLPRLTPLALTIKSLFSR